MARELSTVVRRYDRIARFYGGLEPIFLLRPAFRRRAIAKLRLKAGDTVLEIGCGTGLNLPYLADAVGPSGSVIGVDASSGMLDRARARVASEGRRNVSLEQQDATRLRVDRPLDAVLFGLSYSVLPDRPPALAGAWQSLKSGGRLVIFDGSLPDNRFGRALRPITRLLTALAPGDPDSRPWEDLASLSPSVEVERFPPGIWYACAITKAKEREPTGARG